MLTKTDLDSIGKIVSKKVREEVEAEGKNIRDELKDDIFSSKMRISSEIGELADRTKNVEVRLNSVNSSVTKGFKKIDKRFTDLFDFLDKDVMSNRARIARIEEHLNFPEN